MATKKKPVVPTEPLITDTDSLLAMNPMEEMVSIIGAAVSEWKQSMDPARIRYDTFNKLNAEANTITMKLLGFESDKWKKDEWSLDHCNGRAGESAAGAYLRNTQADTIKEWLSVVPLPTLSAALTKSLKAEAQEQYTYKFRQVLLESVRKQADQDADALVKELSKKHSVDQYIKALALLNQDPAEDFIPQSPS